MSRWSPTAYTSSQTKSARNICYSFAKDSKMIRPLIIENFVLKARKINNEAALQKKTKIEIQDD